MKAALICVALALPATAAPSVRWIDKTGGVRSAAVEKTVGEGRGVISVRLKGGEAATIPVPALLEYVREDDTDEEQARLLASRMRVRAGVSGKADREALEKLAGGGSKPWIREYAAASLAVLGHGDRKFLEANGDSRFAGEVVLAMARRKAAAHTVPKHRIGTFVIAFVEIGERKGPHRLQYQCYFEAMLVNRRHGFKKSADFKKILNDKINAVWPHRNLILDTIALSADADTHLAEIGMRADNARKAGLKLDGVYAEYKSWTDRTELLLPSTRSEPWFRMGQIDLERGRAKEAKASFEKAVSLDPGLALRYRIEAERLRRKE